MFNLKLMLLLLLLLFSSTVVTAQTSSAPTTSPVSSPDSKKITLTEAELKAALDDAWNKGFKAAAEKLAPQVSFQQSLNESSQAEVRWWKIGTFSAALLAVGTFAAYLVEKYQK